MSFDHYTGWWGASQNPDYIPVAMGEAMYVSICVHTHIHTHNIHTLTRKHIYTHQAPGPSKVKTKVVKKVTKWAKGKDPITRGKRKKAVKPKTKKRKKTEEDSDEDEEWVNEEEEEEEGDEEEEDVGEPNVPSPMKDYAAHNISMSASGETAEDGEPFFSKFDPDSYEDSREASKELLKMMISPVKIDQFFR